MKKVTIYTDGSCLGNPGPGAWAAILASGPHRLELCDGFCRTTNNRMEILAVVKALQALKEPCDAELWTDSQYVAKAMTNGWLAKWEGNGWKTAGKKPVKNQDLWTQLSPLLKRHSVTFRWLKGHAGHPENERCDELARAKASESGLPEDDGCRA
ncbi:MAG: ribonuclease HI [Mailhella sp.]|nr:ribonuclease HI [Mailhella sp.]